MWPSISSVLLARWRLIATCLAALTLVWLGWHAHAAVTEAGRARELREQIDARKVAEDRANAIGQKSQELQDRLAARNRELARTTAHETLKPDYRTRLPDAGRLLYNAACCASAGPGQPDGPVPEARPPR